MKKIAKMLVIVNVFFVLISSQYVYAKVNSKAVVKIIQQPISQINVGEKDVLKFNAGDFSGRVLYRVLLIDLNTKDRKDLYKVKDKYYTGIISSGKKVVTVNYAFNREGRYQFIIYVKRAGFKNNDSYVKTGVITVNQRVAITDKKNDDKVDNSTSQGVDTQNQVGQNGTGTAQTGGGEVSSGTGSNLGADTSSAGGVTSGGTTETVPTQPQNSPQEQGIVKSLNVTLGNGNVIEGLKTVNSYNFDLKSLKDDDTVLKINFLLDKNATIEVAGKKFNAIANNVLSINLPTDLGMVDNPPPGITLASIRSYDSSFNLVFAINYGSQKTDITVKLVVK